MPGTTLWIETATRDRLARWQAKRYLATDVRASYSDLIEELLDIAEKQEATP
jgi:hypothetical protein